MPIKNFGSLGNLPEGEFLGRWEILQKNHNQKRRKNKNTSKDNADKKIFYFCPEGKRKRFFSSFTKQFFSKVPRSKKDFFTKQNKPGKDIFNNNKQNKNRKNKPQEYAHNNNQLSKAVMIIQNGVGLEKEEFLSFASLVVCG